MSGFKIIRIELEDNDYLDDLEFDLIDKKEINNGPYFSVIIGQNGTGKSNILRLIINLFRDIGKFENTDELGEFTPNKFKILYSINNKKYIYTNFTEHKGVRFDSVTGSTYRKYIDLDKSNLDDSVIELITSKSVKKSPSDFLPKKIIASSIMLTDKFPIIKEREKFNRYHYLGVRRESSPGTAGTQTYINRTVEFIAESYHKVGFLDKLKSVLKFLDLEEKFVIQFGTRYRSKIFTGDLKLKDLDDFFNHNKGLKRTSDLWGKFYFNKFKEDTNAVKKVLDFCNKKKLKKPHSRAFSRILDYDILDSDEFKNDYEAIYHLRKLDLISYPYFKVSKKGKEIDAEESSSGEAHFISSLISIIATIEDNSLILIDEPELSLHPNWQMKYIHFLNEIFAEYKGCHFIICTHSHFLISDLKAENSKIIALERKDKLSVIDLPENLNTYGWSAEEILLKVFKTPTTRNYYVAELVGKILEIISNSKENASLFNNPTELKNLIIELKNSNIDKLSKEDPLSDVIQKILVYGERI